MIGNNESILGKSKKKIKSTVIFLPIINFPPTDFTFVYSTLKYMEELPQKSNKVPVFDQTLLLKVMQVLLSPRNNLEYFIIRSRGFHGYIGHIMSNSGLGDALELIYAENTVLHLLSGKAVHRAIREH